jgi:hypothetical protein
LKYRTIRLLAGAWLATSLALPALAAGPRAAAAGPRAVTVVNHASQAMREVYVSAHSEDKWGEDRLSGHSIAQGHNQAIALGRSAECHYDLRVIYDDDTTEESHDLNICTARQVSFDGTNLGDRATHDVTVLNGSAVDMKSFYITAGGSANWGDDQLGDDVLQPRATKAVPYRGACSTDIRVVFDNHSAEERHGYDVCANPGLTIAPGWTTVDGVAAGTAERTEAPDNPSGVTVVNQSGKSISALYLYPEGTDERGDDLLGSDTLADDAHKAIDLDTSKQCRFTLRLSFDESKADTTRHNLDLCANRKLTISPSMLLDGRIRNAGSLPIVELYVDAADAPRGPDRLGTSVIARSATYTLSPPQDGVCRYTVTGVFRDGREATVPADLCKDDEVVLQ